ncbi:adenine-specific methyltransferase EcoRI family protein [Flavobacterium taihuense]|uniref:Adenine-specific methyltransferase EcoRI family protein n=1 Tax=Flavobacterium taihuense TaxID=2857508 RepID=A0ABS6Y412_9FLAO|nr:adenine-specific methyltransferase EcoRI family protein [Flavobacterium taihuense]MBW4362824.1 adenine-specific methyltransferase EcoRI family protein [Flavobacterium taihuense]
MAEKTKNSNLSKAKTTKNDEFYTQYHDIEKEIMAYLEFDQNVFRGKTILLPCDDPEWSNFTKFFAQNFERLGLRKLISTSYAPDSKNFKTKYQPTLFETNDPQFDENKTVKNGKIFTLTHDKSGDGRIDVNDLEWEYLKGDGDFKSQEIKKLRDESDIIITNPPFSLFREFLPWIMDANKQFVIIGSMNSIGLKELFGYIKENKIWLGNGFKAGNAFFSSPISNDYAEGVFDKETGLVKFRNCCWYTNIDHGRRHLKMPLMTFDDNLKFSKHKEIKGIGYLNYENYNAIEVPFTDAIPSDYDGVMGVPISFLDKYSPEQFEIVGMCENLDLYKQKTKIYSSAECKQAYLDKFGKLGTYDLNASGVVFRNNQLEKVYTRVLIKHKK